MISNLYVEIENITKSYDYPVLKNISLKITNGDFIAIVGKSGAGKSTLMNILGLIEEFDSGKYLFDGIKIEKGKDYSKLRREKIGFIFQSYNLLDVLSCRENIEVPMLYSKRVTRNIEQIAELLGITHLLDKKVALLSGGEKQRVAIARALLLNPSLIIADEPTGNLDMVNTQEVIRILKEENEKGRAIIMITHDENVAKMAKRIYRLEGGILCEND